MMGNEIKGKEVFNNVIWKSLEQFFAQGVSFVVSIVLARILMPADYGVIAMILVFITIADVFVRSGFSTALIQDKDADDRDFSTIFYCSLIVSIIIYAILFILAPFISDYYNVVSLALLVRVLSLRIPLCVFNAIQHAYVSRHFQFRLFFWSTSIGTILSGVLGIIMAYNGYGVWSLVAQNLFMIIVDTIVLLVVVPWRPKLMFSYSRAKSLMDYGWKIMMADLSGTFFGQLRNLIIGKYYSAADLAFYSRGQQFPSLVYNNIGNAVMAVLFPAISNVGNDVERAKQMTRRAMQVISYLLFPVLIAIAMTAPVLIRWLLTEKWDDCIPFVQILSVDFAIAVWAIAPFQALKAIGKSNVVLKLEFIKKPVYILLLVIGVKISVIAIAITMVLYEIYGVLINNYQATKELNYSFKEQLFDIAPSVLLTVCMSLSIWLINVHSIGNLPNLIIKIVVGTIIYISLSIVFCVNSYQYIVEIIKNRK